MLHLSRQDWIIIYLTINIFVVQFLWMKAEKRVSYLEGRDEIYATLVELGGK